MFEDLINDIKNAIKATTVALGSILGVLTALMFLEGFVANSANISTLVGFVMSWAVFSIVTDELDSATKKILASVGIPAIFVGLAMSIIYVLQTL